MPVTMPLLIFSPILAIIIGIVILIWPKSLNYAVSFWLIINGILGLISLYGGV